MHKYKLSGVALNYIAGNLKTTGWIKIRLPWRINSAIMIQFRLSEYSSYQINEYLVSGYLYPLINQWYGPSYIYTGNRDTPELCFGWDTDRIAYVGVHVFDYVGITIDSVVLGYKANIEDIKNKNWEASFFPDSAYNDTNFPNKATIAAKHKVNMSSI